MNGAVKQITEAEVREVARRLQIAYLVDKSGQIEDPVDALVRTILSQNTSDRNRDVAMARLREYFPDWDAVADAPLPELIDTIRATNYAPTKAQRIQEILRHLRAERGRITLDFLRSWPVEEVERYLLSFKGIGKKTAACVLAFALGRPAFPVDTHVRRVGTRLGWLDEKMSDERAHERMQALCPPELTLPLHFGMWAHGHFTCRPRPRCARCPIYEFCLYPE
ncbi:MAG: endonuclease III, partial [Armatimonadetes bacterium]|nr:endonuclease III [Armatimonadota bacterium]